MADGSSVEPGVPFGRTLHVGGPSVGSREAFLRRVNDMLDRNWLTNRGELVREFESRLDDYRTQAEGSLLLPHRVEVVWPQAELSLEFRVKQWRLIPQVGPDGPQFATPRECRPGEWPVSRPGRWTP